MKPQHLVRRERATEQYLRQRQQRRLIGFATIALLVASVVIAQTGDDWSRFDHHTFIIKSVEAGDLLTVSIGGDHTIQVHLIGVVAMPSSRTWLTQRALGKQTTLLLQMPQTRDANHRLLAFAYIDNQNLSVELAKAGMAYADRRSKCEMDGLIDPAENDARKKKRGLWATLKFDQLPQWRQDWLKSLSHHND